jgi:hypothetical protein
MCQSLKINDLNLSHFVPIVTEEKDDDDATETPKTGKINII